MKPIGILGGTFNPIHEGHIAIAEDVLQACDLERVEFIPCYLPPHRNETIASPEDRLAMVKLAVQNHPNLCVNDYEIRQQQKSYTIKTVSYLRQHYPERSLCLILGSDAFSHFHEWREWEKILDTVNLIVVSRTETRASPAQNINSSEARAVALARNVNSSEAGAVALARIQQNTIIDPKQLHKHPSEKIYFHTINPIEISATQIRNAIANKQKNIIGLNENVQLYIEKNKVY